MGNIEKQAINTAGLWYAYVSVDGKCVYQSRQGYLDRAEALADADTFLTEQADSLTGE